MRALLVLEIVFETCEPVRTLLLPPLGALPASLAFGESATEGFAESATEGFAEACRDRRRFGPSPLAAGSSLLCVALGGEALCS